MWPSCWCCTVCNWKRQEGSGSGERVTESDWMRKDKGMEGAEDAEDESLPAACRLSMRWGEEGGQFQIWHSRGTPTRQLSSACVCVHVSAHTHCCVHAYVCVGTDLIDPWAPALSSALGLDWPQALPCGVHQTWGQAPASRPDSSTPADARLTSGSSTWDVLELTYLSPVPVIVPLALAGHTEWFPKTGLQWDQWCIYSFKILPTLDFKSNNQDLIDWSADFYVNSKLLTKV